MFIKQMDCTDRSTGPDIGLRLSAGLQIEELLSQEREERELVKLSRHRNSRRYCRILLGRED